MITDIPSRSYVHMLWLPRLAMADIPDMACSGLRCSRLLLLHRWARLHAHPTRTSRSYSPRMNRTAANERMPTGIGLDEEAALQDAAYRALSRLFDYEEPFSKLLYFRNVRPLQGSERSDEHSPSPRVIAMISDEFQTINVFGPFDGWIIDPYDEEVSQPGAHCSCRLCSFTHPVALNQ